LKFFVAVPFTATANGNESGFVQLDWRQSQKQKEKDAASLSPQLSNGTQKMVSNGPTQRRKQPQQKQQGQQQESPPGELSNGDVASTKAEASSWSWGEYLKRLWKRGSWEWYLAVCDIPLLSKYSFLPLISLPSSEQMGALHKTAEHFRDIGATVKYISFEELETAHWFDLWSVAMNDATASPFVDVISDGKEKINVLAEFGKWIIGLSDHTLPALCLAFFERLFWLSPKKRLDRLRGQLNALKEKLNELLGEDGVLLVPTLPMVAPIHHLPLLHFSDCAYTGIFNMLELPATAVPTGLGQSTQMPTGLQIVGGSRKDALTIAVAIHLQESGLAQSIVPTPNP